MPVNFDLNDLYAFRALVEYGNFRVAAESICLSQSALSRRIEKLEAALGNRLFDRTTRRVALTLYGQNFAERSAQLLDSVESMLADVDKASEERTGLIAVAAVPSRGLLLYARRDPAFSVPLSARSHQAHRQQRGECD